MTNSKETLSFLIPQKVNCLHQVMD